MADRISLHNHDEDSRRHFQRDFRPATFTYAPQPRYILILDHNLGYTNRPAPLLRKSPRIDVTYFCADKESVGPTSAVGQSRDSGSVEMPKGPILR